MLRELYIEGYRGIKRAEIKDLAQINIFIGKNNSGKSSILEAIYLLSSAFSKSDPLERNKIEYLLSRRGVGTPSWTTAKELLWYNYQTENPIFISTRLDSDEKIDTFLYEWRDVPLIKLEKTQGIDYTNFLLDMVNNQLVDPLNKSTIFHNYPPPIEIIKSSTREYDKFLEYMKNLTLLDFSTIIRDLKLFEKNIWPKLVRKRLDKLITRILKEGYDIKAEGLTYIPTPRGEYELYVELENSAVRVDDLGDGSRHTIYLLAIASLTQNSALLIEEPENHQHPFGMYRAIRMLLEIVKQNNIQLFVSTHSIEFVKFIRDANKKYNMNAAIFFIERDDKGTIIVRRVLLDDIEVLEKMGLDTRFLYLI